LHCSTGSRVAAESVVSLSTDARARTVKVLTCRLIRDYKLANIRGFTAKHCTVAAVFLALRLAPGVIGAGGLPVVFLGNPSLEG